MIEQRRDHVLPSVEDGDPDVIPKLAELVGKIIDCELPGMGIRHTSDRDRTQLGMHQWHYNLVMKAAVELSPGVRAEAQNRPVKRRPYPITGGDGHGTNPLHVDGNGRFALDDEPSIMRLRLHTAEKINGADVILVASEPGSFVDAGDQGMYYRARLTMDHRNFYIKNSYNNTRLLFSTDYGEVDSVGDDPSMGVDNVRLAPDFYYFKQNPDCSVLFRSSASFGPVTVHQFSSFDPETPRHILTSDVRVLSQTA